MRALSQEAWGPRGPRLKAWFLGFLVGAQGFAA